MGTLLVFIIKPNDLITNHFPYRQILHIMIYLFEDPSMVAKIFTQNILQDYGYEDFFEDSKWGTRKNFSFPGPCIENKINYNKCVSFCQEKKKENLKNICHHIKL
jgi:hypothetical protein